MLRFPKAAGADFSAVLSQYQKFNAWLRRGELVGLPGAEFARRVAGVMGASNATIQALERSFTYSGAKKGSGFFSALTTILQS
ncbi:hypothetical protein SMA60_27655, partial [Escherichia coli]|uniref:hypothetical protein n=1 Tax=Escherichia coli TaxID=562 RepID=UPI003079D059